MHGGPAAVEPAARGGEKDSGRAYRADVALVRHALAVSIGAVAPRPGPPGPAVDDPVRIAAVCGLGLLDAPAHESWDGLTKLAARLLSAPYAFLTLVDGERSFWLSTRGVADGTRQNTAQESFCQYVIHDRQPLIVGDTRTDPRTADNPSVLTMGVAAWAGCPVFDADGHVLGSFCVTDVEPRTWSSDDVEVLLALSKAAGAQMQLVSAAAKERESAQALDLLRDRERVAADRLQRLATVALSLVSATSVQDLVSIVVDQGLPVLGSDGGAVVVRTEDCYDLTISSALGVNAQSVYARLPLDSPLPGPASARTGRRIELPTRQSCLDFTPEMADVVVITGHYAYLCTPLRVGEVLLGSLVVAWEGDQHWSADVVELLEAFAAQCAQALHRILITEQAAAAAQERVRLSEALQRSLLTQPAVHHGLEVAVRYLPAASEAQVGGDWHDAFTSTSGATYLCVGDVAGHDRNAAAAMAQLRNLLRGMAVDSDDSPAVLLSRLDRALLALEIDALATVVLVRLDAPEPGRQRRLRWSNAGHLPPVLRLPDGSVRLLEGDSDLLLGLDATTQRSERVVDLPDDALLVLFTDGLVERRGEDLDVSLARLTDTPALAAGGPPEDVCERLLAELLALDHEDDVALLVLRPGPLAAIGTGPGGAPALSDACPPARPEPMSAVRW